MEAWIRKVGHLDRPGYKLISAKPTPKRGETYFYCYYDEISFDNIGRSM